MKNYYRLIIRDSNIGTVYINSIETVVFDISFIITKEEDIQILYEILKNKFSSDNYHFYLSKIIEIEKNIEIVVKND